MRKLFLLVACLSLVIGALLPVPASATLSCDWFCSHLGGTTCAQQGLRCGKVCGSGGCTCTCIP